MLKKTVITVIVIDEDNYDSCIDIHSLLHILNV